MGYTLDANGNGGQGMSLMSIMLASPIASPSSRGWLFTNTKRPGCPAGTFRMEEKKAHEEALCQHYITVLERNDMAEMIVLDIPLSLITLADNDRTRYTEIEELAKSIDENGLVQPITVRAFWAGGYELVAGYRRYHAFKHLERETIPAIVVEAEDEKAARIMWEENNSRVGLNPMDEARALHKRQDAFGLSVEQLAGEVRRSPGWVRDRLSLLQLVSQAQHLVACGQMKVGFALAMVELDANRQQIALNALTKNITLNAFRQLCGNLQAEQGQESLFDWQGFMQQPGLEPRMTKADKATSRFPINDSLPEVRRVRGLGLQIELFIADLLDAGLEDEAAVVGRLYDGMLRTGKACRPIESPLDKRGKA